MVDSNSPREVTWGELTGDSTTPSAVKPSAPREVTWGQLLGDKVSPKTLSDLVTGKTPQQTVLPWYERIPANLGISAVEGFVSGVTEPVALMNAGASWTADLASRGLGVTPSDRSYADNFLMPGVGGTKRVMKDMGLVDNPALAPQSMGEKLAMAGAAGGMSTLGAAPLFRIAPEAAALAKWIFPGITGGIGTESVNELLPEDWKKEHPYLATAADIGGGLAGGLAGGGLIGAAESAIANSGAKAAYKAAQDYADVAKNVVKWNKRKTPGILDEAENEINQAKDTAIPILDSYAAQQLANADNTIERIAAAHGNVATKYQAGEYAQNRFRDWLNDTDGGMPAKFDAAKKPYKELAPADLPAATTNLEQFVNNVVKEGRSLAEFNAALRPHLPDKFANLFAERRASRAENPTRYTSPITLKDLDILRDGIGDARGIPSVVSHTGEDQLNGMYAAIARDQRDAIAKTGNPDALKALDDWNAEANRLFMIRDKVGPKLVSGKNVSPQDPDVSDIVKNLTPTDLKLLRQETPDIVDQIAAHQLRKGKGWTAMEPEEQAYYVPNPDHRLELDLAYQTKEELPKNLEMAKNAEEVGAKADIAENKRLVKREGDVQKAEAEDARDEAKRLKGQYLGGSPARQEHKDLITFLAAEKLIPKLLMNWNVPEQWAEAIGGPLGLGISHALRGAKNAPYGAIPGVIGGEANPLMPDVAFTAPGRTSR